MRSSGVVDTISRREHAVLMELARSVFDEAHYNQSYADLAGSGLDPFDHYMSSGWAEGRAPHALFDAEGYLQRYRDVVDAGVNPLLHYLSVGWKENRRAHSLFDSEWYLNHNNDIVEAGMDPWSHYVISGWREGRAPNAVFDAEGYARQCDLQIAADAEGPSPLAHYATHGWRQGLSPHPLFDVTAYLQRYDDIAAAGIEPLGHYLTHGWRERRQPHALFDPEYYLAQRPDVAEADCDPFTHYLHYGWREGANPNWFFDVNWYLDNRPDVRQADMEPLTHYVAAGWRENADPSPRFDPDYYLASNPDVRSSHVEPLTHFLAFGLEEVRHSATPPPASVSLAPNSRQGSVNRHAKRAQRKSPLTRLEQQREAEHVQFDQRTTRSLPLPRDDWGDVSQLFNLIRPDLFGSIDSFEIALASYMRKASGKKFVVFTAIFGNYDRVHEPLVVRDDCDYILFSDQGGIISKVFEVINVPKMFSRNVKNARMIKTLPHVFLHGYDYSLWVDGSTLLRGRDIFEEVEGVLKGRSVALHKHFQRDCAYQEARECKAQKKDDPGAIDRQMDAYRSEGFPEGAGLVETAQVLRRSDATSHRFNEAWWSEVRDRSIRDQLSFNYVSWKLGTDYAILDGVQWLDPFFKNYLHHTDHPEIFADDAHVQLIMLVRNALEMTTTSVNSILHGTDYRNFGLTIADNASDEDTKTFLSDLARRDSRVNVITNEYNKSFSQANNEAFRSCDPSVDLFLFINNDIEVIDPQWLKKLVREIQGDKSLGAVAPIMLFPNYTIQSAGLNFQADGETIKAPSEEQRTYRHTKFVDGVSGGCMLVRRQAHEKIGGFDPRYFYGQEDVDYCLKLRESGSRIKLVAGAEVVHHESYTRKFTAQTLRNRAVLRRKWSKRFAQVSTWSPSTKIPYGDLVKSRQLNYRSVDDMIKVISNSEHMLPDDIDLVVGIPRSGMIPAYTIGLMLNKPVISFDEFLHDIDRTKGDRPQQSFGGEPTSRLRALFVDDSINFGNSQKRISSNPKETYLGHPVERVYLAVYRSENWLDDTVVSLQTCPLPRIFQWNYLNHGIAQFSCYDMDGVLCVDPTDEENDDGPIYRQFIKTARPLYIPKYPIMAIVTSRLEKYREETEWWLKHNGVKYRALHMLDLPSKEERIRLKAHGWFKSQVYTELTDSRLFVESNLSQSREIAKKTGKAVICTYDHSFYPAATDGTRPFG